MEKTYVEYGENLVGIHLTNPIDKNFSPLILLFPAFEGHSEFILTYGARLVDQGFQVFIADMYGEGKYLNNMADCFTEIQPLLDDRKLVRDRALINLEAALEISDLSVDEIGIMGFCFGGMCALEVARAGIACPAIFAAHSNLEATELSSEVPKETFIMLAQGYSDPMVEANQLQQFAQEMQSVNWSCMFYGNTKHSFTDQNVGRMDAEKEAEIGREYNPIAAQSCFQQAVLFFENHIC